MKINIIDNDSSRLHVGDFLICKDHMRDDEIRQVIFTGNRYFTIDMHGYTTSSSESIDDVIPLLLKSFDSITVVKNETVELTLHV